MGYIRTFVAVDVSTNIRNSAFKTITRLSSNVVDYNWLEKENLHITLNFLGDVDESQIPAVCKLVENSVADFGSFEVSVSGLGCFPKPEKPRVAWLGIVEGREELIDLNSRLADALETMRFPKDRHDYQPHLTLGRIRRGGRYSEALTQAVENGNDAFAGKMIVDQVVVYSSFLDRAGPTYTPMSKIQII